MMSSGTCDQGDGAGCMPGTARAAVTSSGNHAADQASGNSAAAASGSVQPSGGGSGVAVTSGSCSNPIPGGALRLIGQRVLAHRLEPSLARECRFCRLRACEKEKPKRPLFHTSDAAIAPCLLARA
jgi:hypothetical protein